MPQLVGRHDAPFAGLEPAHLDSGEPNPAQPLHPVAHGLAHPLDDTVAAFGELDAKPRAAGMQAVHDLDASWLGHPVLELDTRP